MISNFLCLNSATTEFLLLGLKSQLNKIHNPILVLVTLSLLLALLATLVSVLILILPFL